MKNKTNIPWSLITAYLKKSASEEQRHALKQWLGIAPEHVGIFNEIVKASLNSSVDIEEYIPEKDRLWLELLQHITPVKKSNSSKKIIMLKWIATAAVVILFFGIGNWIGKNQKNSATIYTTVVSPLGSKTQILLPDSTKVWLNSGAELKYANTYSIDNREVFIKGECFFDVVKNQSSHFIVNGSRLKTKVFGTRFNVKDDAKSGNAEITLISGKVQVLNHKYKKLATLKPSEQFRLKDHSYVVNRSLNVDAVTAWTRGVMVFEEDNFFEVAEYLEGWFGITIELDPALGSQDAFNFKIKTESLKEVLDRISIITPIKYKINGDIVTIKPRR